MVKNVKIDVKVVILDFHDGIHNSASFWQHYENKRAVSLNYLLKVDLLSCMKKLQACSLQDIKYITNSGNMFKNF